MNQNQIVLNEYYFTIDHIFINAPTQLGKIGYTQWEEMMYVCENIY